MVFTKKIRPPGVQRQDSFDSVEERRDEVLLLFFNGSLLFWALEGNGEKHEESPFPGDIGIFGFGEKNQ